MPAVSPKQRAAMAIAAHHPEQLYERNKGLLEMSKGQLHDYASTSEAEMKKARMKKLAKVLAQR